MELKVNDGFEFFHLVEGAFNIVFFTANGDKSFNINTEEGLNNLEQVKKIFKLDELGYCIQTHSDIIWDYDGVIKQGDSIITNRNNVGLGVFTADCVPIIIIDKKNKVIAAVHSGWKGTYEEITLKTIKEMQSLHGSSIDELEVFVGPHIRECCYEVGTEVIQQFQSKGYNLENIMKDGKLSLESCIIEQCCKAGILRGKISRSKWCTKCSDMYKFYSYRKSKTTGRLLSLVFIKIND
jgi:YfiH family protein